MSTTSLGMPALPPRTAQPTWKQAWDAALYGAGGFLRSHPMVLERDRAALVAFLADRAAGHHELVLLGGAAQVAPDLARRLPNAVLRGDLPEGFGGLVVAVDWLTHVPTHVVRADDDGVPRVVHVDPVTGAEILGSKVGDPGVPSTLEEWLTAWWPLEEPFARAEVGTTREAAWRDVTRRLDGGVAIAIEAGHTLATRPRDGSLRSPGHDRPVPDGQRDLVAAVALDAVAEATGCRTLDDGPFTRVESP